VSSSENPTDFHLRLYNMRRGALIVTLVSKNPSYFALDGFSMIAAAVSSDMPDVEENPPEGGSIPGSGAMNGEPGHALCRGGQAVMGPSIR